MGYCSQAPHGQVSKCFQGALCPLHQGRKPISKPLPSAPGATKMPDSSDEIDETVWNNVPTKCGWYELQKNGFANPPYKVCSFNTCAPTPFRTAVFSASRSGIVKADQPAWSISVHVCMVLNQNPRHIFVWTFHRATGTTTSTTLPKQKIQALPRINWVLCIDPCQRPWNHVQKNHGFRLGFCARAAPLTGEASLASPRAPWSETSRRRIEWDHIPCRCVSYVVLMVNI